MRTSSRDEELTGETKENTVTKKYTITLNRLPNMQSVLLYPITRLKSDSKIESMQLISIITYALKSCPSSSGNYSGNYKFMEVVQI